MNIIEHKTIINAYGQTQFHSLEKGQFFYPSRDKKDIDIWRRRACRAGRDAKAFRVVFADDSKKKFLVGRIA